MTLKSGVLDPQGKAVRHALGALGFDGVGDVRQGKFIEIDLAESDPERAREYLYLAASGGLAKAQYRLAKHYHPGRGSMPDARSHWKWIRRAADNGHVKAQYRLGKKVLDSPAALQAEAVEWLRRSAEGGYHRAQYLLARCFAKGIGVPRDRVTAYRWMCIARACGNDRAGLQSEGLSQGLRADAIASINLDAIRFNERCSREKTLKDA